MYYTRKFAFTLVEILIVIIILGILTVALITKLTSIQARARDTARFTDLRAISTAIETYKVDNGSYPTANYIAAVSRQTAFRDLVIPSVFAQSLGSSLDTLTGSLSKYIKSLPRDPNGKGIKSIQGTNTCIKEGSSYAYASSSNWYAITSTFESKKGNASSCGGTIDRANDGGYKKEGEGLITNIQSVSAGDYPDSSQWTDASCFTFSSNSISNIQATCSKDIVIPPIINGGGVTSIGYGAFGFKNLTSVIIPNSVTSIGIQAFRFNKLTSVTIPNSVKSISNYAFDNNQLTSVTIPNSVTSIGYGAFSSNQLTSVTIPNSVTSIGDVAFNGNQLTSVTIPNSVTTLGTMVFNANQLTSVTIPNSVTSIGQLAFANNQLTSVTIGNSVISIGIGAFQNNQLTSVTIPNSVTLISNRAFENNKLTSVTIPNSVTSIGSEVFRNNQLTSVTIPSSVTSLGILAFANNGPSGNSLDNIPRVPITAAHGTRNLVGTTWVKQ